LLMMDHNPWQHHIKQKKHFNKHTKGWMKEYYQCKIELYYIKASTSYNIDGSWNLWIFARNGLSLSSSPSIKSCNYVDIGFLDYCSVDRHFHQSSMSPSKLETCHPNSKAMG
jgi:hypothetical protein